MIKRLIVLGFVGLLAISLSCQKIEKQGSFNAVQHVDPQIGSVHGRWFFYTPAALPFGMAKLAPHTNAYESVGSWLPGGYDGDQTSIEGFGHFHEFQIGGVVVMPSLGDLKTVPGTLESPDNGYRSRFDKHDEHSEPGYYSVVLKDTHIRAELTATERVGFHRYTFPASTQSHIIFDIGHKQGESSDVTDAFARLINGREIEGYVETNPEYVKFCDPGNRVKMYFIARLSKTPDEVGTFIDTQIAAGAKSTKGVRNGMYLGFTTAENEVIEMQVGLSYTSVENARLNLDTEATSVSFDQVRQTATQTWNEMLSRLQAQGGTPDDLKKFYTGLYHALLGRGLASDVNGQYAMNKGGIGQIPLNDDGKPRYRHYNTDGMWGGFWNLSQVWSLAYPDYFREYLQSNIDFFKETGWLHDGMAAGTFTNGVQTNFQGLLIAAAYHSGIRDFDLETGYRAARKNELDFNGRNLGNGKYDLKEFVEMGYIPSEETVLPNGWVFNFGASHTLEYCFSSYAVAQLAKSMGHEADYQKLMTQAGYYKNLFDPETKLIRLKEKDGSFIKDFDPMQAWRGYQEGNAVQFTWFVPHDVAGLMALIGKDLFNERLETMFEDAQKTNFGGGKDLDSFSGIEKLYNHGNQPCLHQSWLFNYSGKPWLTQKWTRTICDEFYGTEPLHGYGFGQDEDQGQIGAWYVMAALGLFDVQGHTAANPTFQFGSPKFEKVTINLDPTSSSGKKLTIETRNNSKDNVYVQSLTFNGKSLDACWLDRNAMMQGGTLVFDMGKTPNTQWGVGTPPPSMSTE